MGWAAAAVVVEAIATSASRSSRRRSPSRAPPLLSGSPADATSPIKVNDEIFYPACPLKNGERMCMKLRYDETMGMELREACRGTRASLRLALHHQHDRGGSAGQQWVSR